MDRDLICGWLKLPLGNWPPGPYTLLGLEPGEADLETIEARAQERMGWLRPHQLAYSEEVTEGMNRLAQALVCLTGSIPCKNPEKARKSHRKRLPPPIRAARPKKLAAVVNPSVEHSSPLLDLPALDPLMGVGEMPVVWSPPHPPSRGMRLCLASLGGVGVLALAILLLPIPDPKDVIGRPPTKASPVEMLREVRGYTGFPGLVTGLAFAPDGRRFLFAGSDDTIHLWDPQAGKEVQVFPGHTGPVTCLSFSVDGKLLLSGSEDATVRAWSMGDQAYPKRFDGHTACVSAVALSPDGKQILSCGKDNTLRTWDRATGIEVKRWLGHGREFTHAYFSQDGRLLLASNGDDLKLFDVRTGNPRFLQSGLGGITAVALSSDRRQALSGSQNGTLQFWDVESGQERGRFTGMQGSVTCLAFSPDGHRALSAGTDRIIRLWELPR